MNFLKGLQLQCGVVETIVASAFCSLFLEVESALLLQGACPICFAGLGGLQAQRTGPHIAVKVKVKNNSPPICICMDINDILI